MKWRGGGAVGGRLQGDFAGDVGVGLADGDAGVGGDGAKCVGKGGADGVNGVAVGAEMAEDEFRGVFGDEVKGEPGGGLVAEVAVAGEDALFDRPGAFGVSLEECGVVVAFEVEEVAVAQAVGDKMGGCADVGGDGDAVCSRGDVEGDRVAGVVGNRHRQDGDGADGEGGAVLEDFYRRCAGAPFFAQVLVSAAVGVQRDAAFAQLQRPGDVVAVFVGDEKGGDACEGNAQGVEVVADFLGADAGVDEDGGVVVFEQGAVAGAAAGQDGEVCGHVVVWVCVCFLSRSAGVLKCVVRRSVEQLTVVRMLPPVCRGFLSRCGFGKNSRVDEAGVLWK